MKCWKMDHGNYIGTCENIMSKEKQTYRQRNTRMCKCKNVANYRQKNNQICVWCVGDIFAKMNDFHKMRMWSHVDWKRWEERKMFDMKVCI